MGSISLTDPTNATTADANLIANNNSALETLLNGGLDNTNVAADADLSVSKLAVGTEGQVLTTISGVAAWGTGVPAGVILDYGGAAAPSGWLLCDGTSYLRADYADLFTAIGTTFGAADGTHFNVPNAEGKVTVGLDAAQTEFDTLGETGGAKTHTLTVAEMPSHRHIGSGHANTNAPGTNVLLGGNISAGNSAFTDQPHMSDTGGGGAHDNLQPYIVLNKIIKT